jgi:hypothetical protein
LTFQFLHPGNWTNSKSLKSCFVGISVGKEAFLYITDRSEKQHNSIIGQVATTTQHYKCLFFWSTNTTTRKFFWQLYLNIDKIIYVQSYIDHFSIIFLTKDWKQPNWDHVLGKYEINYIVLQIVLWCSARYPPNMKRPQHILLSGKKKQVQVFSSIYYSNLCINPHLFTLA